MIRRRYEIVVAVALAACGSSNPSGGGGGDAPRNVDSTTGSDAALPTADAPPITVTPSTWTFAPIAGTTCGNGSVAGIAVNGAPSASTDLVVYFEGGGACYDDLTCFSLHTAAYIDVPYDASTFQSELPTLEALPIVERTGSGSATNPFAAASYAYVPYCTGDLGAGTNVATYASGTVHHTGATNIAAFASTMAASFPGVTRVFLIGSDAGGYAATLAVAKFAAAFPGAEVHVLQDSSQFLTPASTYATWQASWVPEFPAGCSTCTTDFSAVVAATASDFPDSRIALATYADDPTTAALLGEGSADFDPNLDTLVTNEYQQTELHAFDVGSSGHVLLFDETSIIGPGDARLTTWVGEWASGSSAWTTIR